jgi:hypothetical protein
MIFKKLIIDAFIRIKDRLQLLLNSDTNQSNYMNCMIEIMQVLKYTYTRFETIYFKYFLYPKLMQMYSQNIGSTMEL